MRAHFCDEPTEEQIREEGSNNFSGFVPLPSNKSTIQLVRSRRFLANY